MRTSWSHRENTELSLPLATAKVGRKYVPSKAVSLKRIHYVPGGELVFICDTRDGYHCVLKSATLILSTEKSWLFIMSFGKNTHPKIKIYILWKLLSRRQFLFMPVATVYLKL